MILKNTTIRRRTKGFCDVHDLTEDLRSCLKESGIQNGLVTVFAVGATAGITTVEYEPGLVKDLEDLFNDLAPPNRDYHHELMWHDGNGFSHVRATLTKPSLSIPVKNAVMRLGTWQQVVLLDFDNRPRDREIAVQLMGV